MVLSIVAIIIGLIIGYYMPIFYDGAFAIYFAVGIMAGIDSVVGAIRAEMKDDFDAIIFVSGFFVNTIAATFLAYIGDMLGLPLYYAALFVFGARLFNNLAIIRRILISKWLKNHKDKTDDSQQMTLDFSEIE